MDNSSKFVTIAIVVAAIGIGLYFTASSSNQTLSNENNCEQQLSAFQSRMTAESNNSTSLLIDPHTYSDFVIGYSPTLNTCIGGFADSYPDVLHGRSNVDETDYYIYNVLTNSIINSFTVDGELIKHPDLKWPGNNSDLDAADQYAWQDDKAALSDLTNGQIQSSP